MQINVSFMVDKLIHCIDGSKSSVTNLTLKEFESQNRLYNRVPRTLAHESGEN